MASPLAVYGSLGIPPTRNYTHILKINFWFYFYYIHKGNKSDKERKIVRKKLSCMHKKRSNTFFKRWVQFHAYCMQFIPIKNGNFYRFLRVLIRYKANKLPPYIFSLSIYISLPRLQLYLYSLLSRIT